MDTDATLAEINPLVVLPGGALQALDSKIVLDDSALFRHADLEAIRDSSDEPEAERQAREAGITFIKLDGDIGCMVNGAGLAMATMDVVKLEGGEPANFLDIGGSASEEAVTEAFAQIILADQAVKGIMVNIFGGIMRCDIIAQGIINAAKEIGFKIPLVVRLEGTNVQAGRDLLKKASADLPTLQAGTDLGGCGSEGCEGGGVKLFGALGVRNPINVSIRRISPARSAPPTKQPYRCSSDRQTARSAFALSRRSRGSKLHMPRLPQESAHQISE
jgi:hypothetical protein